VMGVPESLEVGSACLLHRCSHHAHERNQHDISRPSRSTNEVGEKESTNT
jgi:hypothetical protein